MASAPMQATPHFTGGTSTPLAPAAPSYAANTPRPGVGGGGGGGGPQPGVSGAGAQRAPVPAQQAPAPLTVDPRDSYYADQLARLNYTHINGLAGNQRALANDQAAYTSGTSTLTSQLPRTLANTRNQANSQGLLESGILAQRAGENETAYAQRMGALLSRFQGQQGAISDANTRVDNAYQYGQTNALNAAIARANKGDIAAGPITPPAPTPPTPATVQKQAQGAARAVGLDMAGAIGRFVGNNTKPSVRGAAAKKAGKRG